MNIGELHKNAQQAWVVFSGQADLPWLKMLKPGFRHCFVILNDGRHWITLDPLSNYTDVMVHNVPAEFDFPLWLKDRGHKVMPTKLQRHKKPAPWMVFTCVEAVKRVLGIHKRFIVTPWQLYRHLTSTTFQGEFAWEAYRPDLRYRRRHPHKSFTCHRPYIRRHLTRLRHPAVRHRNQHRIRTQARTGSLLQRGRGVFGTVQNSFRGLLDLANNSVARKILLGE